MQQAQANVQNIEAQMNVQQAQISASQAQLQLGRAALVFAQQQAERSQKLAKDGVAPFRMPSSLPPSCISRNVGAVCARKPQSGAPASRDAQSATPGCRGGSRASQSPAEPSASEPRTHTHSRSGRRLCDELLAQLGDFVNVGVNTISLVDANSFWVDGYFEETNLAPIRVGDPAQIKLMGHDQIVRGHVDSIARAINVANAQPNNQGVATVNPIFTWVRLAQRIPVRIHIDEVPPGVILTAGMTATIEIDDRVAPQRGEAQASWSTARPTWAATPTNPPPNHPLLTCLEINARNLKK